MVAPFLWERFRRVYRSNVLHLICSGLLEPMQQRQCNLPSYEVHPRLACTSCQDRRIVSISALNNRTFLSFQAKSPQSRPPGAKKGINNPRSSPHQWTASTPSFSEESRNFKRQSSCYSRLSLSTRIALISQGLAFKTLQYICLYVSSMSRKLRPKWRPQRNRARCIRERLILYPSNYLYCSIKIYNQIKYFSFIYRKV